MPIAASSQNNNQIIQWWAKKSIRFYFVYLWETLCPYSTVTAFIIPVAYCEANASIIQDVVLMYVTHISSDSRGELEHSHGRYPKHNFLLNSYPGSEENSLNPWQYFFLIAVIFIFSKVIVCYKITIWSHKLSKSSFWSEIFYFLFMWFIMSQIRNNTIDNSILCLMQHIWFISSISRKNVFLWDDGEILNIYANKMKNSLRGFWCVWFLLLALRLSCWFSCWQTTALSGVKLHGNQSCEFCAIIDH